MEKKILLDNTEDHDNRSSAKKDTSAKPNLFQGRTEAELTAAVFPDWDIVPPSLIINPRIKQR
jgi:hypothetical protein